MNYPHALELHRSLTFSTQSVAMSPYEASSALRPWYSDPNLDRRKDIIGMNSRSYESSNARFVVFLGRDAVVQAHTEAQAAERHKKFDPLYLKYKDLQSLAGSTAAQTPLGAEYPGKAGKLLSGVIFESSLPPLWIGKKDGEDYWAMQLAPKGLDDIQKESYKNLFWKKCISEAHTIEICSLRQIGDRITHPDDAAILATSNGLVGEKERSTFPFGRIDLKVELYLTNVALKNLMFFTSRISQQQPILFKMR